MKPRCITFQKIDDDVPPEQHIYQGCHTIIVVFVCLLHMCFGPAVL